MSKKLTPLLVPQIAAPKPKACDDLRQFRNNYSDMMTLLIHRVKTDLTLDHVRFLQQAAINHILKFSRSQLDAEIKDADAWLADLKSRAASEALAIDRRQIRNFDAILYSVS
jgi:hypothetical protein